MDCDIDQDPVGCHVKRDRVGCGMGPDSVVGYIAQKIEIRCISKRAKTETIQTPQIFSIIILKVVKTSD